MKKFFLILATLALTAACAPKPTLNQAVALCIICMAKTNLADAGVKACPRHVSLNKTPAYDVFRDMSKEVFKEKHNAHVAQAYAGFKKPGKCDNLVTQINAGNKMFEFLAVK
jgi:hypothetical protein